MDNKQSQHLKKCNVYLGLSLFKMKMIWRGLNDISEGFESVPRMEIASEKRFVKSIEVTTGYNICF